MASLSSLALKIIDRIQVDTGCLGVSAASAMVYCRYDLLHHRLSELKTAEALCISDMAVGNSILF